ncbi:MULTISPECIES: hypothetical protein [unclassified Sphingobacterium]|uniref:hypothetical protein n=1 Tax=unclassified Sphingobacterium TaxID=2609468 RepID=UPI0025E9AA93|nr:MULTISPECIES: hypothetical protein [unclassified Sphingobacterium]
MIRKITANLIVAFVIIPFILTAGSWANIISGNYRIEDAYYNSLSEYIGVILHETAFPIFSILYLLLILLPYQLIKDRYYIKNGHGMSFWKKLLILTAMIALLWLLIFQYPISDWYIKFLSYVIGIAVSVSTILYFSVDCYSENKVSEYNPL